MNWIDFIFVLTETHGIENSDEDSKEESEEQTQDSDSNGNED